VGDGDRDSGGDGGGERVVVRLVRLVEAQPRADADDHERRGPALPARGDRQDDGGARRLGVRAAAQRPEAGDHVVDALDQAVARDLSHRPGRERLGGGEVDGGRAGGAAGGQPGVRDEAGGPPGAVDRVEQGERQVERGLGEHAGRRDEHVVDAAGVADPGGEVAQAAGAPLAEHPRGDVGDRMKEAGDADIVVDRAEAEGEAGLLEEAVAVEEQALVGEGGGDAGLGRGERVADHGPRGGPARAEVGAHRGGVPVAADRPVRVVVDLDAAGPPGPARSGGWSSARG
jgi:hypothetical protein